MDKAPLYFDAHLGMLKPANKAAETAMQEIKGRVRCVITGGRANQRRRGLYWLVAALVVPLLNQRHGMTLDENDLHDITRDKLKLHVKIDQELDYSKHPYVVRALRSSAPFTVSELRRDPEFAGQLWTELLSDVIKTGDGLILPVDRDDEPLAGPARRVVTQTPRGGGTRGCRPIPSGDRGYLRRGRHRRDAVIVEILNISR